MRWAEQISFPFLRCDKRSRGGELLAQGHGGYKLQNPVLLIPRRSRFHPATTVSPMIVKTSGDFPEILKNPQHEEIYDISKAPVEIWCEIPSDMFVAALII